MVMCENQCHLHLLLHDAQLTLVSEEKGSQTWQSKLWGFNSLSTDYTDCWLHEAKSICHIFPFSLWLSIIVTQPLFSFIFEPALFISTLVHEPSLKLLPFASLASTWQHELVLQVQASLALTSVFRAYSSLAVIQHWCLELEGLQVILTTKKALEAIPQRFSQDWTLSPSQAPSLWPTYHSVSLGSGHTSLMPHGR